MNIYFNKYSRLVVCLIFFTVVLISLPTARAEETLKSPADKQFAFAEALFAEGDYYRAITEYKRFSFFFPDNKLVEKSTCRIGESYFRAKRWQETIDALKSFTIEYPQSKMSTGVLYIKGMAEKQLKLWNDALSTFQEIVKLKSDEYTDKAVYQSSLVLMEMEEWQRARKTLLLISPNSPLFTSANIISSGLGHMDDIPQKSPALAGTLAAILPGAGHLYTERPRDALTAFILNSAFICAAVELFHHENYVIGAIVTFFEIGLYAGNIYSAVSSAYKYNKRIKEDFIQHLIETGSISFTHDPNTSSNNIILSFSF